MTVEEREEDGFLHEVVDALDGGIKCLGHGGHGGPAMCEESVTNLAGEIDFPGRHREDVGVQQTLPEHPHMLAFGAFDVQHLTATSFEEGVIRFPISIGLHGELEGFKTVIL